MDTDVKYTQKTSYRLNSRIKGIINKAAKDIRKETGLKLSLGKLSRAFWISLAANPDLRKKFIDSACKTILEETKERCNKYYYVGQKRHDDKRGTTKNRNFLQ